MNGKLTHRSFDPQVFSELGDLYAGRLDRREGGDHVEVETEAGFGQERDGSGRTAETGRILTAKNGNFYIFRWFLKTYTQNNIKKLILIAICNFNLFANLYNFHDWNTLRWKEAGKLLIFF